LLDAWLRFYESAPTPFTIPGHKQRHHLVGDVVTGDVPLYGGLDTMSLAHGRLADAQARAASLWGADECRFLVGGSTQGNQALALAVAQPGDEVVVSRTLHRSLLLGLVLAGLRPVWVRPDVDTRHGLPTGVRAEALVHALDAAPRARAVFVGDPSYVGTVGPVAQLAEVAHERNLPLIVDAAWGAHFGFHPALPNHALGLGADALVTSAHKTLPAWSQGALVLARTTRIDSARLDAAVEATATTSPSGAILASIDAARALLARDGHALLETLLATVQAARERLALTPGLTVLDGPGVDPTKLVLLLAGTGADGVAVEADLIASGMPVEMAERDLLVAMVTLADDRAGVDALVDAVARSVARHRGRPRDTTGSALWSVEPVTRATPRAAFFAARERVLADDAVGRVSVELVAPYPPGIPLLAPGEEVTAAALGALRRARSRGSRIAYAADPTLTTLDVMLDGEAG
jgi:lysine decarboxylase